MHELTQMTMIALVVLILVYSITVRTTGPFTGEYPTDTHLLNYEPMGSVKIAKTSRVQFETTHRPLQGIDYQTIVDTVTPLSNNMLMTNRLFGEASEPTRGV